MGVATTLLPCSRLVPLPSSDHLPHSISPTTFFFRPLPPTNRVKSLPPRTLVLVACYGETDHVVKTSTTTTSKKSILSKLIQEIEPLEVSVIQKDVSQDTIDAMKRTVSGMLGLLPSDQFQVSIEALWEPLSNLLVSSMVTGYTLQNAEYRLCLERKLGMYEGDYEKGKLENAKLDSPGMLPDNSTIISEFSVKSELLPKSENNEDDLPSVNMGIQGLGETSPEAQQYVLDLHSRLSSMKKELHEIKRKNAALHMQQFVGEEKNDLLDYLRSLQPEKVAQLSESTSPELQETIHSVVHGLLATLSPKMHSKAPHISENAGSTSINIGNREAYSELDETASLQFQPLVSVTRDYLARLLFWCMLLGHYLRGLEYRLELTELFTLSGNADSGNNGERLA